MRDSINIRNFCQQPTTQRSLNRRKPIYGVGINDSWYITQSIKNGKCPYYTVWASMLKRCYAITYHEKNPTYIGCTVCDEWLLFSNFREWMETQDWQGKQLDKDIIIPGNKIYSPSTSIFISPQLNTLLTNSKVARGKYPRGVYYNKINNKFQSRCKVNKIYKHLGYFNTPEEAEQTYNKFKSSLVLITAYEQNDERVKQGLILHADLISRGITL